VRRIQTPHLYHIATNKRIDLGYFPQPPEYKGEWRVDCHPRSSRMSAGLHRRTDGKMAASFT
jgi:hypothetical protein